MSCSSEKLDLPVFFPRTPYRWSTHRASYVLTPNFAEGAASGVGSRGWPAATGAVAVWVNDQDTSDRQARLRF